MMKRFRTSRPTAGRWVMEARKWEFLPPAGETGGKLPPATKGTRQGQR
jgi:hypothetical protein